VEGHGARQTHDRGKGHAGRGADPPGSALVVTHVVDDGNGGPDAAIVAGVGLLEGPRIGAVATGSEVGPARPREGERRDG
jgi:hypothetical protein